MYVWSWMSHCQRYQQDNVCRSNDHWLNFVYWSHGDMIFFYFIFFIYLISFDFSGLSHRIDDDEKYADIKNWFNVVCRTYLTQTLMWQLKLRLLLLLSLRLTSIHLNFLHYYRVGLLLELKNWTNKNDNQKLLQLIVLVLLIISILMLYYQLSSVELFIATNVKWQKCLIVSSGHRVFAETLLIINWNETRMSYIA